jgi:hypothetical protein
MIVLRLVPLALCLVVADAMGAKVEYAVRWDVTDKAALQGRPASADEVVAKLPQTSARRPAPVTSPVTWYDDVPAPPGLPAGYEASFRRRERDGRYEFIYEVRGPEPRPAALPERPPVCGRINPDTQGETLEVALGTANNADRRTVVVACGRVQRSNEVPEGFETAPRALPCEITLSRHLVPWDKPSSGDARPEELRVEEWTFGGGRRIVELAWRTDDTPANEQMFRNLAGYVAAGIDVATSPAKEALAKSCGR